MSREVRAFLVVGGLGYVVDLVMFNLLRGQTSPTLARTGAVAVAMCVTYAGNRLITWRGSPADRRREVLLFVVFNLIGYGFSLACLLLTHDGLELRSALADNISANVIGVGLGTAFRFVAYRWLFSRSATERPGDPVELVGVRPPGSR